MTRLVFPRKDCCGHLALANRYTALDDLAVLQRPLLSLGHLHLPLDNNSPKRSV